MRRTSVGIEALRLFGYHGVWPAESRIGHWFRFDLQVEVAVLNEEGRDDLKCTLDYAGLQAICVEENRRTVQLLETLSSRIIDRIRSENLRAGVIRLRVTKERPGLPGGLSDVFVEMEDQPDEV